MIKEEYLKLKKGNIIILDFGYGPRSDDQPCEILEIIKGKGLFGVPSLNIKAKSLLGGEIIETTSNLFVANSIWESKKTFLKEKRDCP